MNDLDKVFLKRALAKAEEAAAKGGFPAGAVIVKNREIVSEAMSLGDMLHDPTSHCDVVAIRAACETLNTVDLSGAVLYASIQPCGMCVYAHSYANIKSVFFACSQNKLPSEYYRGGENTVTVGLSLLEPIRMTHVKELEQDALNIVKRWQMSLTRK